MEKKNWINKIHCGDVLDVLKQMPDELVDMAITSPPYYNLRNYGDVEGQIGLECHPQEFIDKLTEVFHELKRVLKKSGSFYLNIGDTYFGGNLCVGQPENWKSISTSNKNNKYNSETFNEVIKKRNKLRSNWLQPKQLLMVPYRLASAMQKDGWILRNIIIWSKLNPMPSSVNDRRNNSYEPVFFFAKSKNYYFDMDSIREPYKTSSVQRYDYSLGHIRTNAQGLKEITGYHCDKDVSLNPLGKIPNDFIDYNESKFSTKDEEKKHRQGFTKDRKVFEHHPLGKVPTDVLSINTESFPGAHFATYPIELLMSPIKSSCPQFVCKKCGKPREKITEVKNGQITKQYWKECKCNSGFEGGIVLDPFMGSGTTAVVAKELGRRFVGIELNPEYTKMANERISKFTVIHDYISDVKQEKEELVDNSGLDWSI